MDKRLVPNVSIIWRFHCTCVFVGYPMQLTCMKLGTRELYQPIQSCHVSCLGISNQSVAVPRQESICPSLQGSCCPVWALHHQCTVQYTIHVCVPATCILLIYMLMIVLCMVLGDSERTLNLPISYMCDRHTISLPKSQSGT